MVHSTQVFTREIKGSRFTNFTQLENRVALPPDGVLSLQKMPSKFNHVAGKIRYHVLRVIHSHNHMICNLVKDHNLVKGHPNLICDLPKMQPANRGNTRPFKQRNSPSNHKEITQHQGQVN